MAKCYIYEGSEVINVNEDSVVHCSTNEEW